MLTADPALTIALAAVFGGLYVFAIIVNMLREQKLKKSCILEVDQMSGRKFEEYLQILMKSKGYYIKLTPASGDYGVDLIIASKTKKIIVQAKRYKNNVGIKSVQEIASAKSLYKADECWVITNSHFTEPAKKLAISNKVRLIDREELMGWMLEQKKTDQRRDTA
ncbi:restriction endonuclease [Jeotgalibacillus salarius]|uniref:Restriction endonuclease n=2 Tax=Jeotgalibacillus salarius TaxID=546023 RepID=A0A4Y8LNR3_9BACL|nr:restriction endonuclease [Jeotgalibacillus salarius]